MEPDTDVWLVGHDDGSLSFSGMLTVRSHLNGPLLLIKDESIRVSKTLCCEKKDYEECWVFRLRVFVRAFLFLLLHSCTTLTLSVRKALINYYGCIIWDYLTARFRGCMKPQMRCFIEKINGYWTFFNILKTLIFCSSVLVSRVNWMGVKHQSLGLHLDLITGLFFHHLSSVFPVSACEFCELSSVILSKHRQMQL